jgi:hypothetical protein
LPEVVTQGSVSPEADSSGHLVDRHIGALEQFLGAKDALMRQPIHR